ncbi:MAG: hypothetical protein RLZZ129_1809 [Verrucomicrobiota bacterium]|jgi:hypothetical protein
MLPVAKQISTMKPIVPLLLLTLLLGAGCSTLGSRIAESQAAFNSWPTAVQDKILAGEADIGFTPEQVRVALGDPQKKYRHKSGEGTAEIWAYTRGGTGFSIGLGLGSARGRSTYGGGVVYDTNAGAYDDERLRVVFQDGRVAALESRVH